MTYLEQSTHVCLAILKASLNLFLLSSSCMVNLQPSLKILHLVGSMQYPVIDCLCLHYCAVSDGRGVLRFEAVNLTLVKYTR